MIMTAKRNELEEKLIERLESLSLYDFIMQSFNIILMPDFWAEKNECQELGSSKVREITLQELQKEFDPSSYETGENERYGLYWPSLSSAETKAEKSLKKACSFIKGLYEVLRLRLSLFVILKEEDKKRVISLLKSEEENRQYGGLRSLHLNQYQASVLSPVAREIGFLLEERYMPESVVTFPEEEIVRKLKVASDNEIDRILYLLNSGDEKFIHGGLKSLDLTKPQCEVCKEEGIDTVIQMVLSEKLTRENSQKLEAFEKAKKAVDEAVEKLESSGFTKEEVERMIKCTEVYFTCQKIKSELPKELKATA